MVTSGAVAQLGEHLLCKQGVVGSIPISSTKISLNFHEFSVAIPEARNSASVTQQIDSFDADLISALNFRIQNQNLSGSVVVHCEEEHACGFGLSSFGLSNRPDESLLKPAGKSFVSVMCAGRFRCL